MQFSKTLLTEFHQYFKIVDLSRNNWIKMIMLADWAFCFEKVLPSMIDLVVFRCVVVFFLVSSLHDLTGYLWCLHGKLSRTSCNAAYIELTSCWLTFKSC